MKLNIGSGTNSLPGFHNIDIAFAPNDGEMADGTNLIAVHPEWVGTIDEIHAYHVFEHFAYEDALRAVDQWYQLLKDGGLLVMELPDLAGLCEQVYIGGPDSLTLAYIFGSQDRDGQFHKWGWTRPSLENLLSEAGFREIRFPKPLDYHAKERPCLRVEAVK